MNAKRVTNARTPIANNDLPTRAYVDSRSGSVDLSDYFKKDSSGNVNMNNNHITNLQDGRIGTSDAVNMNNLAIELATGPNINQVILKDGSTALTGNLNLNNQKNR